MKLEEAIKILKYQLANRNTDVYTPINYEAVEVVLNHLTKQEKMIDLMINAIDASAICDYFIKENCENYVRGLTITCNICIREYFEKKAEENK